LGEGCLVLGVHLCPNGTHDEVPLKLLVDLLLTGCKTGASIRHCRDRALDESSSAGFRTQCYHDFVPTLKKTQECRVFKFVHVLACRWKGTPCGTKYRTREHHHQSDHAHGRDHPQRSDSYVHRVDTKGDVDEPSNLLGSNVTPSMLIDLETSVQWKLRSRSVGSPGRRWKLDCQFQGNFLTYNPNMLYRSEI
jgi:hypothetical protein